MADPYGDGRALRNHQHQHQQQRPRLKPAMEMEDLISLLHGSDPVRVELTRLENDLHCKLPRPHCRSDLPSQISLPPSLVAARSKIPPLELNGFGACLQTRRRSSATRRRRSRPCASPSGRARRPSRMSLTEELAKVDGKLKLTESLLESKNLEAKKINDEKKAALAAQFAAEATLRRVHAAQKDDDMPPIEAILAPLEAELKLARQEIAKLQDDNRALDRLTKSKEAALLEAERTVQIALAKASLVDDLQNKNQELMKQIEICQEENKILDRMHRQKVAEVEKLTQTVRELEEAVLAGGAMANAVRDYQRKVQEMNEEMKTLDRELAHAKVSANRVAVVVANEWKDGNDKVMPVKQWLEERRLLQGEMQQLRDKLAIAERAARSEAQLKDKFQLRLKVLEEGLRMSTSRTNASAARR
ncbi:unnamed protein product [Triticum aestivum]|uniref:Uncharacterized protein n=3 Tax=Triticinae TaxID=1648030 RepID=A0A7H4LQF0_WHEAT|nr:unnamed protein product [Triticum aestivum]